MILLQAGATFVGPLMLPVKQGADYITVRSAAPDLSLPLVGVRITPAYAQALPKIVSPGNGQPALRTQARAHHYRFLGIEFMPADPAALVYDLIRLGDGSTAQNSLELVPHHLILDRCYVHGHAGAYLKRGIALNSAHTQIINSYIAECKAKNQDSQAVMGWNGPGPFQIINNYLEGAAENLMFGGADPAIAQLVPSDIEIRGNYLKKPLEWRGVWTVKNLLELKSARRVRITGNVLENNWADGQDGTAVFLTVRNQDGGAPWSVVEDVEFSSNVVRHSASAINLLGRDYNYPSEQTKRIQIKNNLFEDINGAAWGGRGLFLKITETADVVIDHNMILHTGNITAAYGQASTGFIFTNNIVAHNAYGVTGDGQPPGTATLGAYFPNCVFRGNVIAGTNLASRYPPDNFYPATLEAVLFVDGPGGNYRLAATSPYKNAGTDGKDIGCDFEALDALRAGGLSDDFNDNARDPAKWNLGVINEGSALYDPAVPVREQNQRLEIAPLSGRTGLHYGGYLSASVWDLTSGRASVEVAQATNSSSAADTIFALSLDRNNWYRFVIEGNTLYFQQKVAGTKTSTSVIFNATQHRWWRLRHGRSTDSIFWETSPDATTWTVQRTAPRQISITALYVELQAGTYQAESAPGTAIFDNFRLER